MLTSPNLTSIPHVTHGFFTRSGGVSNGIYASLNSGYGSGDDIEKVAENRARVAKKLGAAPQSLCTAYQEHTAKAVILTKPWNWQDAPVADALVTATPGIAIGVLAADCLPILLADSKANVIAAVHSGWKGAMGGVIEAALAAMQTLGAAPENTIAAIGPGIAQASYEVGAEFHARFLAEDAANQLYFIHGARNGHFLFDLKAYAKDRLKNAGISHINMLAEDTCLQENDFFSYRRSCLRSEPAYGRLISAIMLEER